MVYIDHDHKDISLIKLDGPSLCQRTRVLLQIQNLQRYLQPNIQVKYFFFLGEKIKVYLICK